MSITVYRSHVFEGIEARESLNGTDAPTVADERIGDGGGIENYCSDADALLLALREGGLDMFRAGLAMATLIDRWHLTQQELAQRLSLSQSAVANKLRLLRYTESAKEKILTSRLSERHARALLRIRDDATRERCLDCVIGEHLSVAQTERLVAEHTDASDARPLRARGKGAISDLRFLCNSIDRAVDIARQAGVSIRVEKQESNGGLEISIHVENPQNRESAS